MLHETRLKRLAGALNYLVTFAMLLLPASVIWKVMYEGLGRDTVVDAFPGVHIWPGIQTWQVGASLALGCISTLVGLWVLWQMRNLFLLYRMGEVISPDVASILQRIGGGLLALAALPLLIYPLQTMVLTMSNPEGQRSISFGITLDDISFMLAGGLVLLVGWAMGEAARIAEDNRAIV